MVTVRLLGEAGRKFGRKFQLDVKSAAEAVRALCSQIPELRQYLVTSSEHGIAWRVVTEDPLGLDEEGLLYPCSKRVVLAPQPAGRGGFGKIILGVLLVIASVAITFGTAGGGVPFALAGIGMIFGGIAELLTPTPRTKANQGVEEQQNSFTFDKSNANSIQGSVVPVLYGERLISKLPVLSFGIEMQNSL